MNRALRIASRAWFPVVVAAIIVFLLAPIAVIVAASFTTSNYLSFPPDGLTLKWYAEVLVDPSWGAAVINSLLLAISSSLIASVVAVPAALVLSRRGIRAADLLSSFLMLPIMVPSVLFVLGVLLGYQLLDSPVPVLGLILALAVLIAPYILRTLLAALEELDPALEEAAMSLGASRLRAWVSVVLPNVLGAYAGGLALAFIIAFDELVVPLFLAGPALSTLPVRIYREVAFDVSPQIAAVSALLVVVTVLISTLAARDGSATRILKEQR